MCNIKKPAHEAPVKYRQRDENLKASVSEAFKEHVLVQFCHC